MTKHAVIGIRVTVEEKAQIIGYAERSGMEMSEYMRVTALQGKIFKQTFVEVESTPSQQPAFEADIQIKPPASTSKTSEKQAKPEPRSRGKKKGE